ncbi:hypothetical protein CB1_000765096 [Camelus ferus]|nr:hypothetical protein CB1_000765096 [Camelus ferus]
MQQHEPLILMAVCEALVKHSEWVGQLQMGGAWGEGGEQGGGCCQCYFEPLTEQHRRGDSLLWAAPGQAMRVKEEDKTLPKPGPPAKEEGALEGSSKDGSGPSRKGPSEEAQGLSRKRVANAVRKVRGEKAGPGPKPPPPPAPPAPPKPEVKKEAAKDELSVGLRSLMSRGRGKDHKPRGRQSPGKGEKPSSQEPACPCGSVHLFPPEEEQGAGSCTYALPPPRRASSGGEGQGQVSATHLSPSLSGSSGKTEEQIAAEEAWYETEKVWLVHKDGFSLASQLKSEELSLPEGKVRVKLDHDGAILDVDEDDVEKANAPSCDRLEDLASLVYLNESSVLHTLRQRYGASLLHTYAGPSLLVLSPRGAPAVYSEK